jgi:hypothetical protein
LPLCSGSGRRPISNPKLSSPSPDSQISSTTSPVFSSHTSFKCYVLSKLHQCCAPISNHASHETVCPAPRPELNNVHGMVLTPFCLITHNVFGTVHAFKKFPQGRAKAPLLYGPRSSVETIDSQQVCLCEPKKFQPYKVGMAMAPPKFCSSFLHESTFVSHPIQPCQDAQRTSCAAGVCRFLHM